MPDYVFDNKAPETTNRFGALEELYDGNSIRQLSRVVRPGMNCLDIGAGSGSIASWMSEQVGPGGHVLATDINTRFLERIEKPNLEVRLHDIINDPLEAAAFDVVHTRLVLVHLPGREKAVDRMLEALKPGGWIVLEEFDSLSMKPDHERFASEHLLKTLDAMWANMGSRGANVSYGRSLFPLLRSLGLADVSAEGFVAMFQGGSAGARLMKANFMQTRDALIAARQVTDEEFEADLARLDDPEVIWPSSVMWTVKGKKAG